MKPNSYDADGSLIDNSKLVWSVSDEAVISVKDGLVSVKGNGQASVLAETEGLLVQCVVKTSGVITFNKKEIIFNNNASETLWAYNVPGGAEGIKWSSSDERVVILDVWEGVEQPLCIVYVVGSGQAVVTAEYNGYVANCAIYVPDAAALTSETIHILKQSED